MLFSDKQLKASFHSELYNLIPESHLLREINGIVDFSFIYELVRPSYCEYYGRPANEPELLFRLSFLQYLYGLSDERMIQETQVNLAYKWFIGLNPEDKLPDPSQLSRFRNHRLGASHIDDILQELVKQCVEKGLIKSKTIIVDSTHTLAFAQKKQPLEVLKEASKRLMRAVLKKHPKLEKKLPRAPICKPENEDSPKVMLHFLAELGETVETLLPDHEGAITEKLTHAKQIVEDERLLAKKGAMSAIDPDARFGWKSERLSFFGYKEHLTMTEEEIITAIEVTGGNGDDGKQLAKLLEQTEQTGVEIEELIGDTAYSGKDNLQLLASKNIQAIIPLNPIVHNGGIKQEGFTYNKDADFVICPAGEHSIRKAIQGKKTSGYSRSLVFYFDVVTYSIRLVAEHYQEQMRFEASSTFKERIKRRNIIEHKNAELKRFHGMTRAKYRGLFRMRIQAFLTAFAVNVKRMMKLIKQTQPAS